MPAFQNQDYKPPFLFRNGHFNTIYPALFRKIQRPSFQRQRLNTEDGDFLDIDLLKNGNKRAAFLFHGLEGNTDSQYIKAIAHRLHQLNYDIIATNFRGCSGEANKKLNSYHSGFTGDLRMIIETYAQDYEDSIIVGYSLGGNISLKYAGEAPEKVHSSISKIIAVSVPIDLSGGSRQLNKKGNYFYTQNFLKTLRVKVKEKDRDFPNQIDLSNLSKVKTIWDFDEYFTAPMNGFKGAEDYYAQANSLQYLKSIKLPTHLISSLDDPFLSKSCFPFAEADNSNMINLHTTKYGGHVGFFQSGENYWIEDKIVQILEK